MQSCVRELANSFLIFGAVSAAILMANPLQAQRDRSNRLNQATFAECMEAVVLGQRDAKRLNFSGHEFNCKPLSTWRTDEYGTTVVEGTLSHHKSLRSDDQVSYKFRISSTGELGGLSASKVGSFKSDVPASGNKPIATMADAFALANQELDGDWQGSARAVVVALAASLAHSRKAAYEGSLTSRRRGSTRYYNIAPHSTGPIRVHPAAGPAACEMACRDVENCEVWTFAMQQALGRRGRLEPVCRIHSKSSYRGFLYHEHAITGKVVQTRR